MNVAIELIVENKNSFELKARLFYYYARSIHRKPTINNYNPHKVALQTGVSTNTVRRYIAYLKKEGMAIEQGKHLFFPNHRHLINTDKVKFVKVERPDTFQEFLDIFHFLVIKRNIEQQKFIINGKCPTEKSKINLKQYKRYKKEYSYKHEGASNPNSEVLFSSRTLSRLLNIAVSTANNILHNLVKRGLIKMKEIIVEIDFGLHGYYLQETNLFAFREKNKFYLHKGRKIKLEYEGWKVEGH